MNPLLELASHGQSYWLDNLTRDALRNGELGRRVQNEGLRGVTSNPKTFCDSLLKDSSLYKQELAELAEQNLSVEQIQQALAVSDVREGCDVLRPVYEATKGQDGFVSLEVSPRLAYDADASVSEAQRLFREVDRPNLMIKIPGTKPGISAMERLLYDGVNVNITLLFSVERYVEFAQAYTRTLEQRRYDGRPVDTLHSVASFFLSRIDVLVDKLLSQSVPAQVDPERDPRRLLGKVAIANAKLAYQEFSKSIKNPRWKALAEAGAQPQRLLWASTGTKDPSYPDLAYIEPLIGAQTVSTMPEQTITAFADHGRLSDTLEKDVPEARNVMRDLAELNIDFGTVAGQLEQDGVRKFLESHTKAREYLERELHTLRPKTRAL